MITISAFSHVPDIAKGLVRDLRVRWALEEARLVYKVRLLEQGDQNKPEYRALQPFGQVPIFEEKGLVLFESGAPRRPRASTFRRSETMKMSGCTTVSTWSSSSVDLGRRISDGARPTREGLSSSAVAIWR